VSVVLRGQLIYKYRIAGTVPSGKNNTSEANTRRMACYWLYTIH